MKDEDMMEGEQRVTISLSPLRAELGALELRLVDRLNGALSGKADRAVVEQIAARSADNQARITLLEQAAVKHSDPLITKVNDLDQDMNSLREVGKYKKWLWAQTAALIGIAVPIIALFIDHNWITG